MAGQVQEVSDYLRTNKDFMFLCSHNFKYPYDWFCKNNNIITAYNGIEGYVERFYDKYAGYFAPVYINEEAVKSQANFIFASTFLSVCLDELTDYLIKGKKNIEGYEFDDPAARSIASGVSMLRFINPVTKRRMMIKIDIVKNHNPKDIMKQFDVDDVLRDCTAKLDIKVYTPADSSGTTDISVYTTKVSTNTISNALFDAIKAAVKSYKQVNNLE